MDQIFSLGPSFTNKLVQSQNFGIFQIFPKIGNFGALKLEKNFFEDVNQKCNPLRFKISWGRLV